MSITKRKKQQLLFILVAIGVMMALLINATTASYAARKYDLPSSEKYYYLDTDDNGNEVWKEETRKYTYNKKGHVIKYVHKTDLSTATETTKWEYSKGQIAKSTTRMINKGKLSNSKWTYVASYDKKGQLASVKVKVKDSDKKRASTWVWEYDHNKRGWITKLIIPDDNNCHRIKNLSYYKNGMPKKLTRTIPSVMGIPGHKITYKFNKKGLETEVKSSYGVHQKYTYSYDKKGRVKTKWIKAREKGKYVTVARMEYKYGKGSTTDKRVYFGIMNGGYCALTSADVLPGELTAIDFNRY